MTTSTVLITPALGLKFMTDGALGDYAMQRVESLTENSASFPGLSPTPVELKAITDTYMNAMAKCGVDATKSDTSIKNTYRNLLEKILTLSAQSCASIANGDLSLYLLSGYGYKGKGRRTTELDTPTTLRYKQGPFEGSVYLLFKSVKNARSYEVRIGANDNVESWTDYTISSGSPVLMTDLKPLSIYYVRLRAIGARNIKSGWTSVMQVKVM